MNIQELMEERNQILKRALDFRVDRRVVLSFLVTLLALSMATLGGALMGSQDAVATDISQHQSERLRLEQELKIVQADMACVNSASNMAELEACESASRYI